VVHFGLVVVKCTARQPPTAPFRNNVWKGNLTSLIGSLRYDGLLAG